MGSSDERRSENVEQVAVPADMLRRAIECLEVVYHGDHELALTDELRCLLDAGRRPE